jgi:hypothetical protein
LRNEPQLLPARWPDGGTGIICQSKRLTLIADLHEDGEKTREFGRTTTSLPAAARFGTIQSVVAGTYPRWNEIHSSRDLTTRLRSDLSDGKQAMLLLVGAPISASVDGGPGVPTVAGMIKMVRQEVERGSPEQVTELDALVAQNETDSYQAAFQFLAGQRGPDVANRIVQEAVLQARVPAPVPRSGRTSLATSVAS